jgi:hypothetical protein
MLRREVAGCTLAAIGPPKWGFPVSRQQKIKGVVLHSLLWWIGSAIRVGTS